MNLHLEPVMYVVRGYANDPEGYANKRAYDLVLSVFMLGDGRARAFAAHGDLDTATVRALAGELQQLGIHTVLVNRHGVEQECKTGRATGHIKEGT
jgi:hypothetical protein